MLLWTLYCLWWMYNLAVIRHINIFPQAKQTINAIRKSFIWPSWPPWNTGKYTTKISADYLTAWEKLLWYKITYCQRRQKNLFHKLISIWFHSFYLVSFLQNTKGWDLDYSANVILEMEGYTLISKSNSPCWMFKIKVDEFLKKICYLMTRKAV